MADQEDVRWIALGLPDVTEDADQFHFRVRGKGFAWVYPERVHPKKPRVANPEVLVVRVADLGEKEALLASSETTFFTTPHYDGEFRYDRQPVGALQGLAPDAIAYAGTSSKTLAPVPSSSASGRHR